MHPTFPSEPIGLAIYCEFFTQRGSNARTSTHQVRTFCAFLLLPPNPTCANLAPSSQRTQTNQTPQTHEKQPLIPRFPRPHRRRHPRVVPTHPHLTGSALLPRPFPLVHRPILALAPLLSYSQSTTNHKPQTKNENKNPKRKLREPFRFYGIP